MFDKNLLIEESSSLPTVVQSKDDWGYHRQNEGDSKQSHSDHDIRTHQGASRQRRGEISIDRATKTSNQSTPDPDSCSAHLGWNVSLRFIVSLLNFSHEKI